VHVSSNLTLTIHANINNLSFSLKLFAFKGTTPSRQERQRGQQTKKTRRTKRRRALLQGLVMAKRWQRIQTTRSRSLID
jgi:ribosomal protein S13